MIPMFVNNTKFCHDILLLCSTVLFRCINGRAIGIRQTTCI